MYDQDIEELRNVADEIWELSKKTPSKEVESILKQIATVLHHCAAGRKSGVQFLDDLI